MRNPSKNTIKRLFRANADKCTPGTGFRYAYGVTFQRDLFWANKHYWFHENIGRALFNVSKGQFNNLTGEGCEKYSPKGRRAGPLSRCRRRNLSQSNPYN